MRTWARKLWNGVQWPQDEQQFAARWQQINGDHVGVITFYLLSWHLSQRYAQEC